jgi:Zn-dependent peptidase ImmA (M78 family)
MTKELEIKQKAIEYGFDMDFVNSVKVEFSEDGYGYDSKLGKYLPLQKKIILYNESIEAIFPTYCHELTHALQHKHLGLIPYFFALTFLRSKIEKDAREIEDRIYDRMKHEAMQPRV